MGACKFGTTVGKKLADAYASQGMKAYDLLLPVTSDCVVQWACVVEPLVERMTNTAGTFFEALVYNPDTFFYYGSYMI